MKLSIFNVLTPLEKGKYVYSNTMTGSMYKIDDTVKDKLYNSEFEKFTAEELESYKNTGMIVDNEVDEYQKFVYLSNKVQFNYDSLNITMLLTNDCNFKCTYCFQSHDREHNIMNEEVQSSLFEYIKCVFKNDKNLKKLSFVLFGGEPLMTLSQYKEFFEKVRNYCEENDYLFTTQIVTNGSLISKENLDMLYENNCKHIQITLDGVKEVHDTTRVFRNGKGTFDNVVKGIKLVKEYGKLPLPVIRVNISQNNYSRVVELIDYLDENDLTDCYIDFGVIFDSKNSSDNEVFNEKNIDGKLIRLWRLLREKNFKFDVKPIRKWVYCGAYCENYLTVDVDGGLYKCWDIVKEDDFKIGNIKDFNNIDIDKYTKWTTRAVKVQDDCSQCAYLPLCGFGCANLSYQETGSIDGLGCNKVKWLYDDQIRFISEDWSCSNEKK